MSKSAFGPEGAQTVRRGKHLHQPGTVTFPDVFEERFYAEHVLEINQELIVSFCQQDKARDALIGTPFMDPVQPLVFALTGEVLDDIPGHKPAGWRHNHIAHNDPGKKSG